MRIAYIAAGAGPMYCGACHRDAALFRALGSSGHPLLAIPLYTPLRTDLPVICSMSPVFMGGIGMYLEQAMALFRHVPAVFRRQLDRPGLLRGVSRMAIHTDPAKLGPLTVGMLAGTQGPHAGEIERLVDFLRRDFRPDIVNLSNSMLASLAGPLRSALGVPVVSTLQGEESFIAALPEPYRGQAIALLRHHAASIDRFVCCGQERVAAMAQWLDLPQERFAVIPTGLDHTLFAAADASAPRPRGVGPVVLGYLSSIRREKGLDLLIESARQLVDEHRRDVRVAIAGQVLDAAYWRQVRRSIRRAGVQRRVSFRGELDLPAKVAFLRSCDIFIMPTRLAESRALVAMEALASGLPVVAAHVGVLPELLERTEAGLTVAPDDAAVLTHGILRLMNNAPLAREFAANGPAAIARHYSPQAMARQTVAQYQQVLANFPVALPAAHV